MSFYFSPSKLAFFDPAICAPPSDAIGIDADLHAQLLAGQAQGMSIRVGADGHPELAPMPSQTDVRSAADLVAYATTLHARIRDGGITVDVGTSSAPHVVDVASDVDGRSLVSGCVQLIGLASQSSQPAPSFPWVNNDGSSATLTAAQILTIGYRLGAFVQATYATLGSVLAAIGNGTIETVAGIEAAAWPGRLA